MGSNFLLSLKTVKSKGLGSLSFLESTKDIPFEIKRIYYIYDVPEETKRGMHAHKDLQQILWCPNGKVEIMLDNGYSEKNYMLDSPEKALLVLKGYWHKMKFHSKNSVLCVAASDYYKENDYIRDYEVFKNYVSEGYWDNENKF